MPHSRSSGRCADAYFRNVPRGYPTRRDRAVQCLLLAAARAVHGQVRPSDQAEDLPRRLSAHARRVRRAESRREAG